MWLFLFFLVLDSEHGWAAAQTSSNGHATANSQKQADNPSGEPDRLLNQGKKLRDNGLLPPAIRLFEMAATSARRQRNPNLEARALFAMSGCQIRLFQYGLAMSSLSRARELAETEPIDKSLLGGIYGNIGVIYSQLGDFRAAERAALKVVDYLKESPRRDYFVISLGNLGEIEFGLGRVAEGRRALEQAIDAAKKENLPILEATFSDNMGIWLVLNDDLNAAESFLNRGLRIRQALGDKSRIAISYEHLAELEQKRGGPALQIALEHINTALSSHSAEIEHTPHYYPLHVRGLIYLGLGRPDLALADFKKAVSEADIWRQSALPGDATNTRTVAQLTAVYQDYVELAASTSLKSGNRFLAQDAFEVLARHRAATLREQLTQTYRNKLLNSPEYFALLARIQTAQASVTLDSPKGKTDENRKNLDALRAELSDLENRLGLDQQNRNGVPEKNRSRNSLRSIQTRLGRSAALLSFDLGKAHSYLWAVTSSDLKLYELPQGATLAQQARRFRDAVQFSRSDSVRLATGRALGQSLFAQLTREVRDKSEWLLAADGELLDKMPFAYLPVGVEGGNDVPLVAGHSLRVLPGAFLPATGTPGSAAEKFVGVGDAIYNRADPRWAPSGSSLPRRTVTIASLPGSKKELRSSSQASGLSEVKLLTGAQASGAALRQATSSPPEILHFAVHVLSPEKRPGEAALALSLTSQGVPELLTAEAVSTYRVPGSLVVLSGCASQQGEVVAGSGLVGLSRSWLLAGADAVVVSAWPTPDDSGSFFTKFYTYFRQLSGPIPHRAALALQRTQLEMRQAGGYRGDPSYWAAYSLISKE